MIRAGAVRVGIKSTTLFMLMTASEDEAGFQVLGCPSIRATLTVAEQVHFQLVLRIAMVHSRLSRTGSSPTQGCWQCFSTQSRCWHCIAPSFPGSRYRSPVIPTLRSPTHLCCCSTMSLGSSTPYDNRMIAL